jgi:tetratricopeptide (TPR) repeat protein
VQLKKYEAAIENYKKTLKENPNDSDCRFNLTKAMLELQKQKKQQQKQGNRKAEKKEPAKQPTRNELQQTEQMLQMLRRKEKNVQDRLKNNKMDGTKKQDKDW